jgi:hypothetical protein
VTGQEAGAVPGQRLTRWTVTAITLAIVALCFAFSLGNVRNLEVTWNLGDSGSWSAIAVLRG